MTTETRTRSIADRFWGRMVDVRMPIRIAALVFVAVAITSMSFCQLGFWPIGVIDDKPVYLMLILGPLIMGAFMFGPLTGALLGLYAGAVLFVHAAVIPLDFYEVYFMTPLNTFVLLTALGGVSGWLYSFVFRRARSGNSYVAHVVAICVVLSFIASGLIMANTVIVYGFENLEAVRELLFNSPLGVVVQALVDSAIIVALCLAANAIIQGVKAGAEKRRLLSVFRNWMALVSCIVFMASSAVIFSVTTWAAQGTAEKNMNSEVNYLQTQMAAAGDTNVGDVLEGYDPALDGYVVITDEQGVILVSDDAERYPTGRSFPDLLGYGSEEVPDGNESYVLEKTSESGELMVLQATGEKGAGSLDVVYLMAGKFDGGYIAIVYKPEMVYRSRFDTMLSSTMLALALIIAIAVLATVLLNRVVVRHIGETNKSLEKITGGDLNERVNVHDSREFISLSSGINTTVGVLKDTIAEVKQHNAQELATAKAIQESALPTDFPAFPDIDRFDIYASMKTAKEVGGDFYDFFLIEGSSKLGFVMADVSGKGIPAALFMMTAKTQIRTYMESGMPVNEAINAANHQLCLGNEAGMFVTVLACELDYETGELEYVNAGHNPPLMHGGGEWSWMRGVSGMPLGLFDGIPYDLLTGKLEKGDMFYLYTDGVTEAMDAAGNLFGEERLESTLYLYSDLNPRSICVGVRRAMTDFTLDCEQSDDITMLCLKYGVPPEEKAVMNLPATADQLIHVNNYIHAELHRRRAPKSVQNQIDIAAEELFVNVCHYAYPNATPDNPGEVRISFEYEAAPPSLTVVIADDGIPYNPLAKPDAVTPDDIMEVPIGGLGILMAKNSVDEMTYRREGDSNVLTFRKSW